MGADDRDLEQLLGREPLRFQLPDVAGKRVLVTGSSGFLGRRICRLLRHLGASANEADIANGDVMKPQTFVRNTHRSAIIHLAAHKYATTAELHPAQVAELNIVGTKNAVDTGIPVVLASTCKAADPCTVYGASKLIAERIVLNAGGTVLRFVNVLGSTGSVLEIWDKAGDDAVVTDCQRMWMAPREAAEFAVAGLAAGPGRFVPAVGPPEHVAGLFRRRGLGPWAEPKYSKIRRGDRPVERLIGEYERIVGQGPGWCRVEDAWGT